MEEAGDLLEDSWFFGNLLHSRTRTISRSYSDLSYKSCPPLSSAQENLVKNERKNSSVSSRKQPPPVAPPSLTRTPSLPNVIETQYFLLKNPDPNPNFMPFPAGNVKKDVIIKKGPKSSSPSRKQPPVAPSSLTRTSSLSNSRETQSSQTKKPDPLLTRAPSISTSVGGSDHEDEEDQEIEFTLGRLIRQASMTSRTSNPPRQTSKPMLENTRKKPELDQEKIFDARKMERNRSQSRKSNGKNKNGGGAPTIPGGWVDKSSSEDMKAHIKFWARAVASNVRQECP